MTIEEFLADASPRDLAGEVEIDALRDDDALLEAQLLEWRFDTVRSTIWLLFDCRGAISIELGNTALVAATGVRSVQWEGEHRGPRTAWSVVDWSPSLGSEWTVSAAFVPDANLRIVASKAEFHVGNVTAHDGPPPDYLSADEDEMRAGNAGWATKFLPLYSTSVG
jgi:hypothetical protein